MIKLCNCTCHSNYTPVIKARLWSQNPFLLTVQFNIWGKKEKVIEKIQYENKECNNESWKTKALGYENILR